MASVAKRKWTYQGAQREAWVVRYKDKGGAHRSRQFDRKKEADLYCRQVENELEAGNHIVRTQSRTVSDLIDEYMAFLNAKVASGDRKRTGVSGTYRALQYFKPFIGNILLRDLRWQDVEKATGEIKLIQTRLKRGVTAATLKHALNNLSTAVSYGVRREYAARNVVADAIKEHGAFRAEPIERFTQEEVRRLLTVIEEPTFKQPKRKMAQTRLIVYLAAFCGLRRGEIFGLTVDAVDKKNNTLKIVQQLNEWDEVTTTKTTSSIREVPIPSIVMQALDAYMAYAKPDERGLFIRGSRGGNIILRANFYRQTWHPLLERADMPAGNRGHRHFHALRHFAGSSWLNVGLPLPEVSRMLGHANSAITARVYSYALMEAHHRAPLMDQCAALVAPASSAPMPLITQELLMTA